MTSSQSSGMDPSGAILEEIIAESGRTVGERITDFTRLATAVQADRWNRNVSDTERITRSDALWTLMELDGDIREALQQGGLDQGALGDILEVRGVPRPAGRHAAPLHEDFARAMRAYLAGKSGERSVDLADLAAAILRSARDESKGLLPGRLRTLKVDLGTAIPAIEGLIAPVQQQPDLAKVADFSASVRQVRVRLGGAATIRPAQIAASLQSDHPGYGAGKFEEVRLRPSSGNSATTDAWLERVRDLYDMSQVARTRHQLIDGELTLLGLAELDQSLEDDLSADGFLETLRGGAGILPRRVSSDRSDRTEWSPDAPAENDLLGREGLAEALAERVKHLADPKSRSKSSFLVHVDGPWGAGKSSLFGFLERRLKSSSFVVVRINAWREQRVGVPWWTLLRSLRRAIALDKPWYARPADWWMGLVDRIRAGSVPFIAALLVLGAAMVGLFKVAHLDLAASGKAADSILKIVALASAAFGGLVATARYLLPGSRRSAQGFVDTSDNPMHEVVRLFARALRRTKKPVVFLVDDLDRCDDDYVVEFLEVVQTLLRDAPRLLDESPRRFSRRSERPGPYAFVAADGRWIRSSYEKHYETFTRTAVPGRPLGYLFLEKVFQLHVRLPSITPSAREAFFASLLRSGEHKGTDADAQDDVKKAEDAKKAVHNAETEGQVIKAASAASEIKDPVARMDVLGAAAVKFSAPAIEKETEHALARFKVFLEPNPRSMRLFVNTYGVLRSLRALEEVFVDSGPLALWTVIEIRWPYLADYLRADPQALGKREAGDGVPDDIKVLFGDEDVCVVLDDTGAGPLTPELVRQCAGT